MTVGVDIPANGNASWTITCPPGKQAVGGGVSSFNPNTTIIRESAPLDDKTGWYVTAANTKASTVGTFGWAVCMSA
jgi:hypothetical protein